MRLFVSAGQSFFVASRYRLFGKEIQDFLVHIRPCRMSTRAFTKERRDAGFAIWIGRAGFDFCRHRRGIAAIALGPIFGDASAVLGAWEIAVVFIVQDHDRHRGWAFIFFNVLLANAARTWCDGRETIMEFRQERHCI